MLQDSLRADGKVGHTLKKFLLNIFEEIFKREKESTTPVVVKD